MEIMETDNMQMYEAPKLEVIEVEVEKGFAVSGGTEDYDPQPWYLTSSRRRLSSPLKASTC